MHHEPFSKKTGGLEKCSVIDFVKCRALSHKNIGPQKRRFAPHYDYPTELDYVSYAINSIWGFFMQYPCVSLCIGTSHKRTSIFGLGATEKDACELLGRVRKHNTGVEAEYFGKTCVRIYEPSNVTKWLNINTNVP